MDEFFGRAKGQIGESGDIYSREVSHCSSKTARRNTEMAVEVRNEVRERTSEAEFCPDDSPVGEGDGLEDGVAVGEKMREDDMPDSDDCVAGKDGVEVGGGVRRLEGIGMGEVREGTGEPNEPVILLMVKNEENCRYGLLSTGSTEVKFT